MRATLRIRTLGGLAVGVGALVVATTLAPTATATLATATAQSDRSWSVESRTDASSNAWAIQYLLRSRGFELAVDGAFGPETEDRVRHFQEIYNGMAVDGIVGPQTWAVLILNADERPDGVRAVQSRLSANGFGVCIDGIFGPATQKALRSFQEAVGVKADGDGIVSVDTWEKLVRRLSDEEFPAGPQPC